MMMIVAAMIPASNSADSWMQFWRVLTHQIPLDSNTAVVLRGTILLGLACGVVGTFLLLRRRSLMADALAHAALPGVAGGFLLASLSGASGKSLAILLPAAALFGLLGVACVHLLTRLPRVKEDAAIGVVLSVFFAIGIVLLSVIQRLPLAGKAGLDSFIFGQAAAMSRSDATTIAIASCIAVGVVALTYKELKVLCFDPGFVRGLGWSTLALDGLLLALITTLTVIGLHAVGAILMVALLIIPPAAARFWTHRLGVMIALAAVFGAVACHVGTAASAAFPHLPTGPAIVIACGSLFIVSMVVAPQRGFAVALVQRWSMSRHIARQHLLRAMYEHGEIVKQRDAVVTLADLFKRRVWSPRLLQRSIKRSIRLGEIVARNGGFALSERGRAVAERIVRTHRLWEHFLTTQADIAPSHVDRAADDIEHVLSDELVRDLEEELHAAGALEISQPVPASPHQLANNRQRSEVVNQSASSTTINADRSSS